MCISMQGWYAAMRWAVLLLVLRCGYGGDPGPSTCTPDVCPPAATCTQGNGYISCVCPEGKTGTDCTQQDPCVVKTECTGDAVCYGPCDPNVVCIGATGYPHCTSCIAGYKSNGTSCLTDLDECIEWKDPPACLNGGQCTNQRGDFTCTCIGGWSGKECSICKEGTVCDEVTVEPTTTPTQMDTPETDKSTSSATSGVVSWSLITGVTLLSIIV